MFRQLLSSSLPARFVAVGLLCFIAGRATNLVPHEVATLERSIPLAEWREEGSLGVVAIEFAKPLAVGDHDDASRDTHDRADASDGTSDAALRGAFAIEGGEVDRARRSGGNTIVLTLATNLPRARKFAVELLRDLPRADGGVYAKGLRCEFATPGPRVAGAVPTSLGDDGARTFRLDFDLPVTHKALEAALVVRAPDGTVLPRSIALESDSRAFDREALETLNENLTAAGDREWSSFRINVPGEGEKARTERIEVSIDPSLRSSVGPVAISGAREFELDFQRPLSIEGVQAYADSIVVSFGHDLGEVDATRVSIVPPVPFRVARLWAGEIGLFGEFDPGARYVVEFAAGFPGRGFSRLAQAVKLPVSIPDSEPSLEFEDRAIVLSAAARPEVGIEGVNVEGIVLRGKRVLDHNAVHFLRQQSGGWRGDPDAAFSGPYAEARVSTSESRNARFRRVVDLSPVLGEAPRGLFLLELRDTAGDIHPRHALVALTDLRVAFRVDGDRAVAYVSSVATGASIAGASIELFSRSNQKLAEGITDANGITFLTLRREAADEPFCAFARWGDDRAFVDLDHFGVFDSDDDDLAREYVRPGEREAFVASDRPVVRPGESVSCVAVLRDALLRAAPGACVVRWFDAREDRRGERRIDVPASGLASFEIETHQSDPTGLWRIELFEERSERRIGGCGLQVATVAIPRCEVDAAFVAEPQLGQSAVIDLRGRWLSGVPLTGARAVVSLRLDPPLPSIDALGFTTDSAKFRGRALPSIETALDTAGNARVEFVLPGLETIEGAQRVFVGVDVEVFEPDGRVVERRIDAIAAAAGPRLGMKQERDRIELRLAEGDGTTVPLDATIELELAETTWVWEHDRGGRSRVVENRVVWRKDSVALVRGVGHYDLEELTDRFGITATARYDGRRVDLDLGAPAARPDHLRLTAPTTSVTRGASFPLTIDSPVAGVVLLSIEGGGIHAAERFEIVAGSNQRVVKLPSGELPPNVRVVATLARPQRELAEAALPAFYHGATTLAVESDGRVAAAQLEAPESVFPGQAFDVTIHAAGATEAIVAVVDAGALFGVARPFGDPLAFFSATRRSATRAADSAASLRIGARFEKRSSPGGDAPADLVAALMESSGLDQTTVAFSQRVVVDASGVARARIDLKEHHSYEGRLEIVVLAAGSERLSIARQEVRVAAPLSVQASGPRLLRAGDRCEFTLVVKNETGVGGDIALDLACDGPFVLGEGAPRNVRLESGASATLVCPIVVDSELRDAVAGELRVGARLAQFERAVSRAVRIVPRDPIVTRRETWVIEGAKPSVFLVDHSQRGKVSVRVEFDGRPQARLAAAEASLADYPHGCTEQVSSQVLARLGAADFGAPAPDGSESRAVADFVAAGVRKILAAQFSSGGFSFWPRAGQVNELPTLHACETLLSVAEQGFAVPPDSIDSAVRWLTRVGFQSDDEVVASTAAELASRAGRPSLDAIQRAARCGSREARARAALALARIGDKDAARETLLSRNTSSASERIPVIFESETRVLALELRAWLLASPGDPRIHDLASTLLDRLDRPERWTTHELAHGLLAARDYFRAFASTTGPRHLEITCGGSRRSFDWPSQRVDFSVELEPGAAIEVLSDGAMFGRVTTTGRWTEEPAASRGDLSIVRELRGIVDDLPLLPGEGLRRTSSYRNVLRVTARSEFESIVVIDPIPAGCEPDRSIRVVGDSDDDHDSIGATPTHVELRDGVALFYFDRLPAGETTLRYVLRSTTRGEYARPPARVSALYSVSATAVSTAGEIVSVR